jgi:pimeloyl-ACP methyl ester carboxylesterase
MGEKLDQALAILNGAVGDYLARTDNGLATEMAFIFAGRELSIDRDELSIAHPNATARLVILIHGVMCTETIWRLPDGSDYGALLREDFGFTPFYLRYNSGRAIADNGAALSRLLETLLEAYPVAIEEIMLLGYSMGGLVARSACHAASLEKHAWLTRVRRAIYVGTPHLGAPLERAGRVVAKILGAIPDPYTKLIADLANLRSDGVKDLGDADLRHEDRARRVARYSLRDPKHPVPLLASIEHHLVAGTLSPEPWLAELFGDSIVPLSSATHGACIDGENVKIVPGHAHIDLARRPEIYQHIRGWCA